MNIAIIGYGRMGHLLEKVIEKTKYKTVAIIDPKIEEEGKKYREISKEALENVSVCVDFTVPEVVLGNVKKIAALKKNMVIATTGWYSHLEEVKKVVEENNIGLIYSPNFSLGMNIFFRIIEKASKIFDRFEDYDPFVFEEHHRLKKDSPSGTAIKIGSIIIDNMERKKKAVYEKLDRKINPEELHVVSLRGGTIPGIHIVGFDSKTDLIKLEHEARSPEGFVQGALKVAEWIKDKKGFYSIEEMMEEIISNKNKK